MRASHYCTMIYFFTIIISDRCTTLLLCGKPVGDLMVPNVGGYGACLPGTSWSTLLAGWQTRGLFDNTYFICFNGGIWMSVRVKHCTPNPPLTGRTIVHHWALSVHIQIHWVLGCTAAQAHWYIITVYTYYM